ncbi:MAG TPA: dienelactone hydrolase family protein [Chitinophagaceae bacterium]
MKKIYKLFVSGLFAVSIFDTTRCFSQFTDLHFGNYSVGFKYVYQLDKTREWLPSPFDSADKQKTTFRPLRIAIWYPAEREGGELMKFKNYINPEAPDIYYGKLNDVMNTYDMWSYNGMFDKNKTTINSLLNLNTNSIYNAKEKTGKYPLVLYCCGWFSRSPDNALMAEYLASHGYVVITVPQLGTGSTTFDFKVTEDRIITQVQDLQFALNYAVTLNNVDKNKIASAGFSIGGIVQLWLSQQDERIKALVALDASFMFKEWAELSKKGIQKTKRNFPILSLYRGNEKLKANINTEFFKNLSWANKALIEIPKATHGEFSDEAYLYAKVNYPWKHTQYNTLREATNCYQSVIKSAEAFLNFIFSSKDDAARLEEEMQKISDNLHLIYLK